MSVWVCPHCPTAAENDIKKISGLPRLYAYPCEPGFENGGFVIIDSGAFGLSQAKKKMSVSYMKKLSEHYEKYHTENVFCVAPDEFLNPQQTMFNFVTWQKTKLFSKICPVLQSDTKYIANEKTMLQQAEFYKKKSDSKVIFFSNPSMYAEKYLDKIFKKVKEIGFDWIHCLGAGWDIEDVKKWGSMQYLDSFDSIAYYTTKDKSAFGSLDAYKNVTEILRCLKT